MAGLTKQLLREIGVEMDDQTLRAFNDHFEESLHQRVVDHVLLGLTPEQTSELANLRGANDDYVWRWLTTNVTNLNDIVRQEVDAMLVEVVRTSDHL